MQSKYLLACPVVSQTQARDYLALRPLPISASEFEDSCGRGHRANSQHRRMQVMLCVLVLTSCGAQDTGLPAAVAPRVHPTRPTGSHFNLYLYTADTIQAGGVRT